MIGDMLLKIFNGSVPFSSLDDLAEEGCLWSLLSDLDDKYFPQELYSHYEFTLDGIVRLMVNYACSKCKVEVSSRYTTALANNQSLEQLGSFLLFLMVHSDNRQRYVEKIMHLTIQEQKKVMLLIEDTRKQLTDNDYADLVTKIGQYQAQLQTEIKKVTEKDEEITKLTTELQTVLTMNKQLKKSISVLQEQQRQTMEQLNVTNFQDVIHMHGQLLRDKEQAEALIKSYQAQVDEWRDKCQLAVKRIQQLQQYVQDLKQNINNTSRTRDNCSSVLQQTQQSYIYREVARLSMKQDNMRMEIMMAKKASQKQRFRLEQKQQQLTQLYRHLKHFEKRVKKIKAERNPELDSLIRSTRTQLQ